MKRSRPLLRRTPVSRFASRVADIGGNHTRRMSIMSRIKLISVALLASFSLAACSGGMDELEAKVTEIKGRPGERIEPIPEIKPDEPFTYSAASLRSPFV